MVRMIGAATALLALATGLTAQARPHHKGDPPPPITISATRPTIPAPAPSPSEQYGDWTATMIGAGTFMATTLNNAGSVFGTACTGTGCFAILNPKIQCTPGDKYPILVNAPGGSFASMVTCEKIDDLVFYSFDLDDHLTEAMAIGGQLGVAFPMASGQFEVSRFSLTGAARATARIQQLAQGRPPATAPANASDQSTL